MSNNLASQELSIPGNPMEQHEPISSKLGTPMSVGFGIDESFQPQISSNMEIGQMDSMPNNLGSQLSSASNHQGGYVESQAYTQLPQRYLMSNKPVGQMIPTMLDSIRPHQLPTLYKRKEPVEPIAPNSLPKKLALPNKQVAHMEHRPWLQPISAPRKRPVQMQSVSSSPGSELSPASNKRSVPNKTGSSASRNQPAQMRPSPKVQTESSQSMRSKMRESLAGALALFSQQQGENATVDKNSNGGAASSTGKTEEGSHLVDSGSGKSDAVCSISAEPRGMLLSNWDGAAGGNNSEGTQVVQCKEQQFLSSNLLPDEVPFTDNIFARDELLQGNGLSWVSEPEFDAVKKTELGTVWEKSLDNEKVGKDGLEQSLQSPEELAYQIEVELFKLFRGVNKKYKEKGRSLLFNLKDRSNPELRESVVSGKITPQRLCAMSAEELASKELSEWRQAKAEELAQMVVLPDVEVDIRRLVRKTHKGEFQVEVEQTDSASVEVSAGTSTAGRPRTEAKKAPRTIKTVVKKDEYIGEKSNPENPNLTITIPTNEGPDPMQGLMGENEMKVSDFLPEIVSLDEFMQSLDSEPPFENLPDDARKATTISDQDDSEAGSDSKSYGRASQDPVKTMPDEPRSIKASNMKSDPNAKLSEILPKTETIGSVTTLKSEHVWEGMLELNISAMASVICAFKSGERTSAKLWPGILEIKGRVRLEAFEKFLQELPMSRSRAVMVIHVVCKDGSTDIECQSLVEAADSYISDKRVGFAEPVSGVELYCCPPHVRTLEMLNKILPKDQIQALGALENGLIGVVVWRRAELTSPDSSSHHKHTSKKQHFSSRRHQDKESTNMNYNSPSKPMSSPGGLHPEPPPDDVEDDDVPPGFGPGTTSWDEDDLPEFNFSGGSNPLGPQNPAGYRSQQVPPLSSTQSYTQASSRPIDQMRELIQKYGQPDTSAPQRVPMQQWNDNDDDDIPEWQPQTSQQQPPPPHVNRFQHPMHAPQQALHVQKQNAAQPLQQGTWWVPPPGSQDQQILNGAQFYGQSVGTAVPGWPKDAPNSRGF
ncbi:hypothetical protein like AT5G11430 [Hibiscus trionum]|uniref:TFIIS central domain-containing protein n=1 Tax=Hibiscus trionum TaxID=183268 RepID=A0A9W7M5G3_HIBTR|nr:hypothetical protein like AT5G11430 [Hibiscus trionum]